MKASRVLGVVFALAVIAGAGRAYGEWTWTPLDFGLLGTVANGIDGNNIVGYYSDSQNYVHSFLYNGSTLTVLDYPEAQYTFAYGISGNDIVGYYYDSSGNSHGFLVALPKLTLTFINPSWGTVDVEPNLSFYSDPNTVVTLTAAPIQGKSFNRWVIWDPNYPGDDNYIVYDANNPTTILMDSSQQVRAEFKCGGGLGPMLPLTGVGLGGLALMRRRR